MTEHPEPIFTICKWCGRVHKNDLCCDCPEGTKEKPKVPGHTSYCETCPFRKDRK